MAHHFIRDLVSPYPPHLSPVKDSSPKCLHDFLHSQMLCKLTRNRNVRSEDHLWRNLDGTGLKCPWLNLWSLWDTVCVYVCLCLCLCLCACVSVPSSLSVSRRGTDCSKNIFLKAWLVSLRLKKMLVKNYHYITNCVLNIQIVQECKTKKSGNSLSFPTFLTNPIPHL